MSGKSPQPDEPVGYLDAAFEGTEQAPEQNQRHRGKLEGAAWRRRKLITELARGEKTMRVLASENGVSPSSIHEFKERHLEDIAEALTHLGDEFDGVWIAQKINRLIEMEDLYSSDMPNRDRETRLAVLRAAAEELGQIPNRTTIDMALPVHVVIEGGEDV